jgi:hypothetical protein
MGEKKEEEREREREIVAFRCGLTEFFRLLGRYAV